MTGNARPTVLPTWISRGLCTSCGVEINTAYKVGNAIMLCKNCYDKSSIEMQAINSETARTRESEQIMEAPPIARSPDVMIDLVALCAKMQSWARTQADANILVRAIAEIKNLRVKSSAIEALKAKVGKDLPPRISTPTMSLPTPVMNRVGACPSCGSTDYSSPTCYECEAVRSRRIIAKLIAILHRNKICEKCGENLRLLAFPHVCMVNNPGLSESTKKRFTKKSYLGNYTIGMRVLDLIDYFITINKPVGNNVGIDEAFFKLQLGGADIELHYNDIINPISNELHDILWSLRNSWLIVQPEGSTIEITEGGHLMLDEYRADHAKQHNSKCVKCGSEKLAWDHVRGEPFPICSTCANDVADDMLVSHPARAGLPSIEISEEIAPIEKLKLPSKSKKAKNDKKLKDKIIAIKKRKSKRNDELILDDPDKWERQHGNRHDYGHSLNLK